MQALQGRPIGDNVAPCVEQGRAGEPRPSFGPVCESSSLRVIQSPSHPVSESSDAVANCRVSARPSPRRRGIFLAASLAAAPARRAGRLTRAHVFCRWPLDQKQVWAGQESNPKPLPVTGLSKLECSLVFGSLLRIEAHPALNRSSGAYDDSASSRLGRRLASWNSKHTNKENGC